MYGDNSTFGNITMHVYLHSESSTCVLKLLVSGNNAISSLYSGFHENTELDTLAREALLYESK